MNSLDLLICSTLQNHNTGGVFTLPDADTDAETDTDAIGFETHCVGAGTSVGKGKICVGVGQCEHTMKNLATILIMSIFN